MPEISFPPNWWSDWWFPIGPARTRGVKSKPKPRIEGNLLKLHQQKVHLKFRNLFELTSLQREPLPGCGDWGEPQPSTPQTLDDLPVADSSCSLSKGALSPYVYCIYIYMRMYVYIYIYIHAYIYIYMVPPMDPGLTRLTCISQLFMHCVAPCIYIYVPQNQ